MDHQYVPHEYEREGNDITASDMIVPEEDSDLLDFYRNSTVFITGATGFLGKLCMEKLLRTCSVNKIFILVRPKKGKDPQKRFDELFDEPSFEPLRRKDATFRQKVHIINGDVSLPELGISKEDQETLVTEVDCIFHFAATVRFDEKIKTATHINVRGTRDMLRISKRMKKLRAFVHISTAYSNCVNKVIEEKFYSPPITGEKLISLVECLDDDKLTAITPALIGDFPNTYTFTKAVAENVLKEEGKNLPLALYRPSIVVATAKEPVAGWIDNIYGATGVLLGVAIGLLRVLEGRATNHADMVPADFVVNSSLAVAWEVATIKSLNNNDEQGKEEKFDKEIPVYNYVCTPERPLTWEQFQYYSHKHAVKIPSEKCIWWSMFMMQPNKYLFPILLFLLHTVPAYLVDGIAICIGKKPMLVKGYQKINKFVDVIGYFCLHDWDFKNNNTQALWQKLKRQDKELFDFNMKSLDWDEYFITYTKGSRIYILKDPLDTVPQGRKWYIKLGIAHYTLMTVLSLLLLRLAYFLIGLIFKF